MKLLDSEISRRQSGAQGPQITYSVQQSGKVMELFSNLVYSDKIAAPIRELATNAWDAHIVARNQNTPIDIYLPTERNLTFKIRDYGTGLSKQQIEKLYTTYGASDKTESNELTGCLGIGSKSPFAYTGSFTTVSYYNGRRYTYINAKNTDGVPTLQLFDERDTNEPNGLEVSFAVKNIHISDFKAKSIKVLSYFPKNAFKITPDTQLLDLESSYILSGKTQWHVTKDNNYNRKSYIIMGCVRYPIDNNFFSVKKDNDVTWYQHSDNKYINLLSLGLDLYFDLGELDIAASRESLQYTNKTISTLKSRLDAVLNEIKEQIETKIKNSDCYWNACLLCKTLVDGPLQHIKNVLTPLLQYNGRPVTTSINLDSLKNDFEFRHIQDSYRLQKSKVISTSINDKVFILGNLKTGNHIATIAYLKNKQKDSALLITKTNASVLKDYEFDTNDIDKIVNTLGITKQQLLFSKDIYVKPPKAAKKKTNKFLKYQGANKYFDLDDIDIDQGGLYIETAYGKVNTSDATINKSFKNQDSIIYFINFLSNNGITLPNIIFINGSNSKKIIKNKKWNDFFKWAKHELTTLYKSNKDNIYDMIFFINKHRDFILYKNILEYKLCNTIKNNTLLKEIVEKTQELSKTLEHNNTLNANYYDRLAQYSQIFNILSTKNKSTLEILYEKVNNRYDFLGHMYNYRESLPIIIKLANLVDSAS